MLFLISHVDHRAAVFDAVLAIRRKSVAMARSASSPQELLPTTRIGRREFIAADVGNKHVLMNVENGIYIGLDAVGKGIWERLEEPQTIAKLCEDLQRVYEVLDQPIFEREVTDFLGNLRLHGLVEVIP